MLSYAELLTHIEHSLLWNASHITFYSPPALPRWQHSLMIDYFSVSVDGWQHKNPITMFATTTRVWPSHSRNRLLHIIRCNGLNSVWLRIVLAVGCCNPLNAELNPICYLLALLAHHFLHVSRIRVKSLTLKLLMSYIYIYIYGAPILDVSRSHATTQHSR